MIEVFKCNFYKMIVIRNFQNYIKSDRLVILYCFGKFQFWVVNKNGQNFNKDVFNNFMYRKFLFINMFVCLIGVLMLIEVFNVKIY